MRRSAFGTPDPDPAFFGNISEIFSENISEMSKARIRGPNVLRHISEVFSEIFSENTSESISEDISEICRVRVRGSKRVAEHFRNIFGNISRNIFGNISERFELGGRL